MSLFRKLASFTPSLNSQGAGPPGAFNPAPMVMAPGPVGATGVTQPSVIERKGDRYRRLAKTARRIYEAAVKAQFPSPDYSKTPDDCITPAEMRKRREQDYRGPYAPDYSTSMGELPEIGDRLGGAQEFDFLEEFDAREMVREFVERLIKHGMNDPQKKPNTAHGICFISVDDVEWLRLCVSEFIDGRALPTKFAPP